MNYARVARWTAVAILLALFGAFGSCAGFYLPSTEKVYLTGTEIKRLDAKDGSLLHDVRYIQARKIDGGNIVFRNEDTRWGFPFYFKFNSSDLASEAQGIANNDPQAVVLVTFYGVRSQVLDLYPNAVSFKKVPKEYVHVPIFNIVFFVLLVVLCALVFLFTRKQIRRLGEWWAKRKASRSAPPNPTG